MKVSLKSKYLNNWTKFKIYSLSASGLNFSNLIFGFDKKKLAEAAI